METEDQLKAAAALSERFKRSLVNQLAHRLMKDSYQRAQRRLQGQLDQAEMRGYDAQLLVEWMDQLHTEAGHSADASMS